MTMGKRSWSVQRHLSAPLLDLLVRSGLTPHDVDAAIEEKVAQRRPAILRADHPCLMKIACDTGIAVVAIARRHKQLLMEIEQRNGPHLWRYRELSREQCRFSISAMLPAMVDAALVGRPLARLVEPTAALAAVTIADIDADGWGGLDLLVQARWIPYG